MCMDSGIRISNVDGADYSIDDTCVEKAKFEGYEVVPVSSACAWVVCLDALADDTCPNATRDQVYERWLQIADDREQPFGFRSDEGNRYKAVCTPTQPVDGKCCFLLEVAEATC